jgi:hypothetical protein
VHPQSFLLNVDVVWEMLTVELKLKARKLTAQLQAELAELAELSLWRSPDNNYSRRDPKASSALA